MTGRRRFEIGDTVVVRNGELKLGPGTITKKKPQDRIYQVSLGRGKPHMWVEEERLMTVHEASLDVIRPAHD